MFSYFTRPVARVAPSFTRSFSALSGSNALISLRSRYPTAALVPALGSTPASNPLVNPAGATVLRLPGLLDSLDQKRWKARGHTYQPSTLKRKRVNGFLARLKTKGGQKVIARRKAKGRWFLSH